MSKNNSPRFQSVVCACGVKFDREVKRGRPQVWCPSCALIPFYERTTGVKVVATAAEVARHMPLGWVAPEEAPARIRNENDPYDSVRELIEAQVVEINRLHKELFAELVAAGLSREEAGVRVANASAEQYRTVYAQYKKETV
jgi:hypothetical protein